MDEAEVQETEVVETTETQATEVVETQDVKPDETVTDATQETQNVDNVEETVETEENTETMYSEKELLEKFSDVAPDLESLIALAKEGLAHRNEIIEQALTSGVRSLGNAFNKEAFAKTFSNMTTKDIKEMGEAWEKQVSEKFSTDLVSKQKLPKEDKQTQSVVQVDLSTYRTLGYGL